MKASTVSGCLSNGRLDSEVQRLKSTYLCMCNLPAPAPPMMPIVDMWAWVRDEIETLQRRVKDLQERVEEQALHDFRNI